MKRLAPVVVIVSASLAHAAEKPIGHLPLTGLNLAGAEFGEVGGAHGSAYRYPSTDEIDAVARRGFTVIRLPFLWERLQPKLNGEFDQAEAARLDDVVRAVRARKLAIILDLHNFARFRGDPIGSAAVPMHAFADVWRRLAARYRSQDGIIFGLMNEPHDMATETWADAAQAGIEAIRATGACNHILVPGNDWSGAHSWASGHAGAPNAQVMTRVRDPAHRMSFEFHQYLDADFSGRSPTCVSPDKVVAALSVATDWLKQRKATGFLGEIGAGSDPTCLAGLDAMLAHLDAHPKQWIGWTAWAAGAWWPKDYPLLLEPRGGADPPQLRVFEKWRGPARASASFARCEKHPRPGRGR